MVSELPHRNKIEVANEDWVAATGILTETP
jgi:hypothetical protein